MPVKSGSLIWNKISTEPKVADFNIVIVVVAHSFGRLVNTNIKI